MRAHLRAVRAHEVAAELYARLGDTRGVERERARAAAERSAIEAARAAHPEWAAGVPERFAAVAHSR